MARKQKNEDENEMATVPIMFQLPPEFISEFKNKKQINDKEISTSIEDLRKGLLAMTGSLTRHRMESQSSFLQHKKSTQDEIKKHGENVDQIEKELKEAFDILWPKFDAIEKSIKDNESSSNKKHRGHETTLVEHAEQIAELSSMIEKRYQSALKKINQQKDKVEVRIDNGEVKLVKDEIARLEKLIKEAGKYEYGSSLNILNAAVPVGFTGALNFKSGFTIALNPAGYIDITGTGAGGLKYLVATGTVDNSNTTFTFTSTPTLVVVNGVSYRNGHGVTITGTTAVLDNPAGTGGDVWGLG